MIIELKKLKWAGLPYKVSYRLTLKVIGKSLPVLTQCEMFDG